MTSFTSKIILKNEPKVSSDCTLFKALLVNAALKLHLVTEIVANARKIFFDFVKA